MKRILVLFLFLANLQASGQSVGGETELGGFILGQFRTAVHQQLGAPIQKEITDDRWIYEFHAIKPDTSVYVLFKYPRWDTTRIYSIQLNGERYDEMHPFYGFKLGSRKEEADRIFGQFDHTKEVADPPLTIQYYKNKNYSIEIEPNGIIYGIQIFGDILETKPKDSIPSLSHFKHAVVSRNVDSLLFNLSPDVKFYHGANVLTYSGAAREEFKKTESEFIRYLLGPTGSVWYVFTKEMAEGSLHSRINKETNKVTYFYQFFDSNLISEITFAPHAGKWKVHSIHFR